MSNEIVQKNPISPEDERLLKQYIAAFCNLYGITPVYRAWRIIHKQNPDLAVSEEQFLAFLDNLNEDELFCIVVGEEEIYEGVEEPTPPRKREIVAEYLYAVDDFESYEELKEKQADKPFYVPDKDELLKYADNDYGLESIRTTREYQALHAFAEETLKLKNVDGVLDDIQAMASIDGGLPVYIEDSVLRIGRLKKFPSEKVEDEFYRLCEAMCNNVRMHAHRGHTPREIALIYQ